jgi:hypothetical protein
VYIYEVSQGTMPAIAVCDDRIRAL